MNRFGAIIILWCAILCWGLSGADTARSESSAGQVGKAGPGPMVIHSDSLEADDKKGTVTFTGKVDAQRDDFTVTCDNMVVTYVKTPDKGTSQEFSGRIEKIVATGNVTIVRAEGGVATGEKAVYYQDEEKLVLTGKPVVKQNDNSVEGDRITLFLREDRSVVESASDKRVRAVIFPSKDKGKGL